MLYLARMPSFFLKIMKERFWHIFSLLQMDLARASLVLIRVLCTFTDSIAKNLHKLKICLRFCFFIENSAFRLIRKILDCEAVFLLLFLVHFCDVHNEVVF